MEKPILKKEEKDEFDIIRDQLENELLKLNQEEYIHFKWLCALRALPFLGSNGNFNFWNADAIQINLLTIFDFFDLTIKDAINTIEFRSRIKNNFFTTTNYAAYYALRAIFSINPKLSNNQLNFNFFYPQYKVDSVEMLAYSSLAAGFNHITFTQMILKELKEGSIWENGSKWLQQYGQVWSNFNKALEESGCGYWASWYYSLFEKNFLLNDEDEIEINKRIYNVPIEIRYKGASSVASYILGLDQGAEKLNESRILILGDKGVGKTCLARRLEKPDAEMTSEEESTPGVNTSIWKLEKENVNVHLWDFAGHTVTHAVHQFFLSERCLYIIVFDGRTDGNNRWQYWLDHMKNYGKDSKAIILVNKRDAHAVEVPINKLKEQYPILDVCTFSIRDDKAELEKFRQEVADYITNNPSWSNLLIPDSSYKVKKELEKLFNNGNHNGQELIERNDFDTIAEKCQVEKEKVEGLLSDLHALGISLWYKDMVGFNTLVLNPEWISNGVYQIINWANNYKTYSLTIEDLKHVFEKEKDATRYPEKYHHYLCELIINYELAYKSVKGDELIIPRLLHEDQPADLPQFSLDESLIARYKADQPLMPDTISRFIVRHNKEIKKEGNDYLVWRSGVILEQTKGTIALVRETDDRTISVSVKGSNKTEYLSALRETLNFIFEGYKSKKPELQYRVQRYGEIPQEIEKQDPLWLPDQKILNHALDNIPYYDDKTRQNIYLHYTVNNYHVTAETLLSGTGNQYLDQSIHNTFNFKDCNISLQGNLNELARHLTKAGKPEEAEELKEASTLLAVAEECTKPEEVKKKGILHGLQQFAEKLGDEKSSLCKTIKGIEKGVGIAQDIAKEYNKLAQWLVLPQIPNVFLKK
jgi:small GTP-binding protein